VNEVGNWREHLQAGRLAEALRVQLAAPQPDARVTELLEGLTELRGFLRAKQWERARKVAEALAPESSLPQLSTEVAQLGQSGKHLERGEADEALALLEGVHLPLLRAEAQTQRGTAQVFLGDADAAERAFQDALSYDPRHYRALTNLGNVALEQGRTDDAIAHYREALALNENFANAHHNLGVAYRRKGQVNKSVASIRRAQRVSQQREREEARGALKALRSGRGSKYLKWLLYGLATAGIYLLLRAQGVL
jgi:tetratricopeptide (TPR) repeat protein